VLIDGRAGTGKSVLIRKLNDYCEKEGLNYVNLAPTNKAALNINGKTLHKFFALSRDSKVINAKKFGKLRGLDYVFIDEISMVSSLLLRYLYLAKLNNKKVKIVCVGDHRQLAPVGEKKHMGSDCLKFICDYQKVNMTVNKRFDEELREAADKWYLRMQLKESMFGNSTDVKRFLCYTNRKRKQLNARLMEQHKNPKRFLVLPCATKTLLSKTEKTVEDDQSQAMVVSPGKTVEDDQSQAMVVSPGMPVICRKNCANDGLVNNDETHVINFNKKTKKVRVANAGGKEEFGYVEFTEFYNPAYAITIHRSQGQTYTDPFCIAEIDLIN
jgi:ATP-dependent exoDNAse (exonuclease V) alpha subunit